MKTIRCRNCGITYQSTATICLRCLSPLNKEEDKTGEKTIESAESFNQEKNSSIETTGINSILESQSRSEKLVQHVTPEPIRMKSTIPEALPTQHEQTAPQEINQTQTERTAIPEHREKNSNSLRLMEEQDPNFILNKANLSDNLGLRQLTDNDKNRIKEL